jgi:hypothetical protein
VIDWDGLYPGTDYDGHIFDNSNLQFEPHELILGDGHYISCPQVITPIRKNQIQDDDDIAFNVVIQNYRARVEHVIGFVTHHACFKTAWRGGINTLCNVLSVSINTSNVVLKARPHYQAIGPWGHF